MESRYLSRTKESSKFRFEDIQIDARRMNEEQFTKVLKYAFNVERAAQLLINLIVLLTAWLLFPQSIVTFLVVYHIVLIFVLATLCVYYQHELRKTE